ncbi:dihydrolipoyllysine-residue acetyltransferase [Granulosicoccaceae sp. 1_MG-2023]|nr:dihydrolipoyllysine-residue acetyltransferase [Granulosicoccaceae sp. 1_MG-2023]
MSREIQVPDIGDFAEVDVIEVLVNVGDTVSVDDPLLTLESDKASMDIPSSHGGVVEKILVNVGDKVSEGTAVVVLSESDEPSVHVASDTAQPKVSGGAEAEAEGETQVETVRVPDIGDFDSVDVIEVLVQEGDTLVEEQSMITLESDKASMDIPSPSAGLVKSVKVVVGDKVSKGDVILLLETTSAAPAAQESKPAAAAPAAPKAAAAAPAGTVDDAAFKRVHASPSVRRIARELGVDLSKIPATGPHGRVTEADVRQFKETGGIAAAAPAAGGMGIPVITQPDWSKFGEVTTVPMSRINKLSAKHLHRAWLNVPQVTQFDEADITELEAYRQAMKGKAKEMGFNLTPLVFMMKAVVSGLKVFPKFNSAMDDAGENLIQRSYYNIGIAVDTPDGLVVPVVRDVDRKGLFELAAELGEVSKRAREGQLKAADMQGGCFSISSLGGIGGTNFTPIVNAPEVGILGLTRAQSRLVRKDGEIVDALIQPLAVSYDHRVIDGAYAARFASHLAFILSDVRNLML